MLKPLQKVRRSTPFEVHIEISESECEMAGERLLRAVLSFYREEADDLARLEPLLSCRLSRGWSALRVDCTDRLHLEQINELIPLLRAPLDALQLVRQIRLMATGVSDLVYTMKVNKMQDQQA